MKTVQRLYKDKTVQRLYNLLYSLFVDSSEKSQP
jgi:hypothetical protein